MLSFVLLFLPSSIEITSRQPIASRARGTSVLSATVNNWRWIYPKMTVRATDTRASALAIAAAAALCSVSTLGSTVLA